MNGLPKSNQAIAEIISADAFRLLVGNDFSPKYRLVKDDQGQIWTVTKILKDFKSANNIFKEARDKDSEDRNERIRNLKHKELGSVADGDASYEIYKNAYIKAGIIDNHHFNKYIQELNLSKKKDDYKKAEDSYSKILKNIDHEYLRRIKHYNNLVSKLENFNYMIATSLFIWKG